MLLAFSVLTTCQLQLNQFKGLALQVIVPKGVSSGARSVVAGTANARDVAGPSGANVQVTIQTQAGAPWQSSEPIPTSGKTSVDFAFPLPPPGTYKASVSLFDGSGNLLSQAGPISFSVPAQTNPVVITMPSNLLNVVITDNTALNLGWNDQGLSGPFSPVTYTQTTYTYSSSLPFAMTLTPVDPSLGPSNITVTQNGTAISSTNLVYSLGYNTGTVTVVVGTGPAQTTYTIELNGG
jgi:hypothetical protein